ncbi:BCS1 N terminal-domain-containing protein [Aspergillus heterothallicus]
MAPDTGAAAATAILEAFIPGYSLLSRAFFAYFQIDLSMYIPYLLAYFLLATATRYIYAQLRFWFWQYCTSTVEIRSDNEVYDYVMFWLSQQKFMDRTTHFIAETRTYRLRGLSHHVDPFGWAADKLDSLLDPTAGDKLEPLSFTPSGMSHYRYKAEHRGAPASGSGSGSRPSECLYFSCVGRNPAILQSLRLEARRSYAARNGDYTWIYGFKHDDLKQKLITDIEEYLDSRTQTWYSNRGIPYRRGYLLHGPPGAGKTSLTLTENGISKLFHRLPARCIVLIEDVDCAGMASKRSSAIGFDEGHWNSPPSAGAQQNAWNHAQAHQSHNISLSDILNVIDGAAACQGRILVMTTNHLEKLDPALIRPGRGDLNPASPSETSSKPIAQAASIPKTDTKRQDSVRINRNTNTFNSTASDNIEIETKDAIKESQMPFPQGHVTEWAAEFSMKVPSEEFSPADIQGYLLLHKTDPEGAIAGVEEWVRETREKKAAIANRGEVVEVKKTENRDERQMEEKENEGAEVDDKADEKRMI